MIEPQEHFNSTPKPTPANLPTSKAFMNFSPTPGPGSRVASTPQVDFHEESEGVIYGTNISVRQTLKEIEDFLMNFSVTIEEDDEMITKKVYWSQLLDLKQGELGDGQGFQIDGKHLHSFSQKLYLQLIYYPVQMISFSDYVLQELYEKTFVDSETQTKTKQRKRSFKQHLKVEFANLMPQDKTKIKDLVPNKIGRLVSISGLPIRLSEIYPQMKEAAFECDNCLRQMFVPLSNAFVEEPKKCPRCLRRNSMVLVHNSCSFTNKQYIKFQEMLHNVSEGQGPASVQILAYDSHVDKIRPGDSVEIVGIYRCNPVKVQRGKNSYLQIFHTYFDLISFKIKQDHHQNIKGAEKIYSEAEKAQFFKMANRQSIIDDLVSSFAPSIYGNKEVKKGILAQLMGGTKKQINSNNFRSDINICLVGDPSTAKSQMLQHVHRIAPRSIYTCGRGSSASGLTATVRKDPETKEFILESGALVLGDLGICCIDEFDKMNQNARLVLLEVMEQQTISIAKAGIVCRLNSRTAILAAANPVSSKYDARKSVIENINLPPTLLSRFDLLYIMLDIPTQDEDRRIAAHILDIYSDKPANIKKEGIYPIQTLSKFISFAKDVKPLLNEEAGERLVQEYIKIRKEGLSYNSLNATPRLLESLIRISEAFAKMRLSSEARVEDVEEAIALLNFATLRAATDPQTGVIDMDIITTGRTSIMKKKAQQMAVKIKELLLGNQQKYSAANHIEQLEDHFRKVNPKEQFSRNEILEVLNILKSQDFIYLLGHDKERPKIKLQQFNES